MQVFCFKFQAAAEFIPIAVAVENEFHQGLIGFLGQLAAHMLQIAPLTAAGLAVEGIAHGIENGGLAGAGLTADEKQAVLFKQRKIDKLLGHVRAKALKTNRYRLHASVPSSRLHSSTSRNSCSCSGLGSAEKFSARKRIIMSSSFISSSSSTVRTESSPSSVRLLP